MDFIEKHRPDITGTLSGLDRLILHGTIRFLAYAGGLFRLMCEMGVLLKQFGEFAEGETKKLLEATKAEAARLGRPLIYLGSSSVRKDRCALEIAAKDKIQKGLICTLTAVEPCWSYDVHGSKARGKLEVRRRQRKCLHIYRYLLHPTFGFMHVRLQTWFPMALQVYINGREWLARQMDAAGLGYLRKENCFLALDAPERAQQLMSDQLKTNWEGAMNEFAVQANPLLPHYSSFIPMGYYWSVHQSEWATDIMFKSREALARLYPNLVHHGIKTFKSPDAMRFLGLHVTASGQPHHNFKGEVVSDLKHRPEGVRLKHMVAGNSIKLYDKQGSVLRVETTINSVRGFKAFRRPEQRPGGGSGRQAKAGGPCWMPMRRGVADLHRRTEISDASNRRYLEALASVEHTATLQELARPLCEPARLAKRPVRALNPLSPKDARLLEFVGRPEFAIAGLRNGDLRQELFPRSDSPKEQKRHAAVAGRQLRLLRAHGLLARVPKTHRYTVTSKGRDAISALLTARNASVEALTRMAA